MLEDVASLLIYYMELSLVLLCVNVWMLFVAFSGYATNIATAAQ
jgi:hypothetical protein